MKDGRTHRVETKVDRDASAGFLASHDATLVFADGPLAGSELALDRTRVTLGRSAVADLVLDHASISHEHAALELFDGGYRVRDLGSTNGVRVNGAKVGVADLKHGDRLELGSQAFRYLVAERPSAPPTYRLR